MTKLFKTFNKIQISKVVIKLFITFLLLTCKSEGRFKYVSRTYPLLMTCQDDPTILEMVLSLS